MSNYKKTLKIIQCAMRFCWRYILINVVVVCLTTTVGLLINFVNSEIINRLTLDSIEGSLSAAFFGLILVYVVFYLFQKISGFLGAFGINFYKHKVDQLFWDIFNFKSYKTSQAKFLENDFAQKHTFAQHGITRISKYIENILNLIFSNIATIATTVVVFAIHSPLLIVFLVAVFIISYFLHRHISNEEYRLAKQQINEQRYSNYYKSLLVDKASAKELRIYKLKLHIYKLWSKFSQKLYNENLALQLKKIKLHNLNAIIKISIRTVSVFILLIGVYNKSFDVGVFVLLLGFANTASERIDALCRTIVSGAYNDVKHIVDYYDFAFPVTKTEIAQIRKKDLSAEKKLSFGDFKELKLQNVSYTYPNSADCAVKKVNLTLKKGEIISILGYNGSGKTTLSKLLSGSLFPQDGTVSLNDVLVTQENKSLIFEYFGIAAQEYAKFSLSIDEFINLGDREIYSKETLEEIYQKMSLQSILDKHPNRGDTILGKAYSTEGVDLSGGEWQLLNIASAYAQNPQILLLDEPTASIDPIKEEQMIAEIRANIKDKTAILISHRLGFARIADRIIMMRDGEIIEQGTHEELLAMDGYYASIFREQKSLYN